MTTQASPGNGTVTPQMKVETTRERLQQTRRLSFRRWFGAQYYDIRVLLLETRISLIGLLVLLISGTLYLRFGYDGPDKPHSLLESFFETMRMLVVEHGLNFPDDPLGQFLFLIIPLFGLIFVVQSVLDFGRRLLDKTERLIDWQVALASTHSNHVVVCGLGRVSYRVMLQLLDSGYEVVVVEQDWQSEFVADTLALKVPVIKGDARNPRTLQQAGVVRASGVIAGVNNDLLNIEIGLAARRLRPDIRVVLRIFSDKMDERLEQSRFGPNSAFSSSALAAPTLAAAAVCQGINYALPLGDDVVGLAEVDVVAGSKLENLVWRIEEEFQVQVFGYMARNGSWNLNPTAITGLFPGDRILVMGTLPRLSVVWRHGRLLSKMWERMGKVAPAQITQEYNRVIVCGLGRVGYRVVQALHRMKQRPEIVVICNDEGSSDFIHELEELGIKLVKGSATDEDVLQAAGIHKAYSVAAVTSDNLVNLQIGLTARQLRPDIHVVLRVFSDVLAEQLESMFGINTAFSTSALAAPTLSAAAVLSDNSYAITAGDQLLATATVRVQAGDQFEGQRIRVVRESFGIVVVMIQRYGERSLAPSSEQILQAGDELMVLADIKIIARLREHGATAGRTVIARSRRSPQTTTLTKEGNSFTTTESKMEKRGREVGTQPLIPYGESEV
ncbi:MAG: potassium transporter TrkA [Chloroflexaceae bacterium]|nr:potassium transporter TrkA [Chloroflexaceae bacterium]